MKRCSVSFTGRRTVYKNKSLFFLNKSMLLEDVDILGENINFSDYNDRVKKNKKNVLDD